MVRRSPVPDIAIAFAGIALVTSGAVWAGDRLEGAAVALLYLLPVLAASARGNIWSGVLAALGSAMAFNFFFLPPRFTFAVHGISNAIALLVLLTVALVTTHLAASLARRETEARAQADAAQEREAFAALLAETDGVARGIAFLSERFGEATLTDAWDTGSPMDHAAARWAADNGETTGFGTAVIPAADWTFAALDPRGGAWILAVARRGGNVRTSDEIERIEALARLLGQAKDREALALERQQRGWAEERSAWLRNLLASLAHDLRTPLTVVRSAVEAGAPDEVERELARLERTIRGLLDVARIESGAVGAALEPVDLVDIVQAALEDCTPMLRERKLEVEVPATLPLVRADPLLLRQILVNLVDNAARYGRSAVGVSAVAGRGSVSVSVTDDGPGIPRGEEAAIFERFVRLGGGDRAGSGLGLAIVKGFADAMGASVTAASRRGGGARFVVELEPVA